jgi:hypothetical protein
MIYRIRNRATGCYFDGLDFNASRALAARVDISSQAELSFLKRAVFTCFDFEREAPDNIVLTENLTDEPTAAIIAGIGELLPVEIELPTRSDWAQAVERYYSGKHPDLLVHIGGRHVAVHFNGSTRSLMFTGKSDDWN